MNRLIYARLMVYMHGIEDAYKNSKQNGYINELAEEQGKDVQTIINESVYGNLEERDYNNKKVTIELEHIKYIHDSTNLIVDALKEYNPEQLKAYVNILTNGSNKVEAMKTVNSDIKGRLKFMKMNHIVEGEVIRTYVNEKSEIYISRGLSKEEVSRAVTMRLTGIDYRVVSLQQMAKNLNVNALSLAQLECNSNLALLFHTSEMLGVRMHKVIGPVLNPDSLISSNHMFFSSPGGGNYLTAHPIETEEPSIGELMTIGQINKLYSSMVLQTLEYKNGEAYLKNGKLLMDYINEM